MRNTDIAGSIVVVTGGTGTFGQAFVRHLLSKDVKQVRVFSRDELKQYEMERDLNDPRVEFICGDVRDLSRITEACQGAEIVVHAAAMKRLERCERDPQEAIKTNVIGSTNVANACIATGVYHAISLSSDKAVYPVNAYGRTKALMENVWIQSNNARKTRFSVVRYGNVVGSRGSVVDIFREQAKHGPIKVTNIHMTRFFMPVEYAIHLVEYAIATHQGGETFVPRLKASTIVALASLFTSSKVVRVPPRPGEKAHEDIATEKELLRASMRGEILVIDPEYYTWNYNAGDRNIGPTFPLKSCDAEHLTTEELKKLIADADARRRTEE